MKPLILFLAAAGAAVVLCLAACSKNAASREAAALSLGIAAPPDGESAVAVRYFSRSGNTEKIARSIAGALGVEARSVTDAPSGRAGVLFLGAAPYKNDVDKRVKAYIETLDGANTGCAVVFSTGGTNSAYPILKPLLEARGIPVYEKHFFCRGRVLFLQNRGRPNADDIENAARFAREIAAELLPR